MTEQQRYRVLEKRGDVELREYAECVVADVEVTGAVEQAAMSAFQPLFSYISGANSKSSKLSMTAPVIQQSAGEKLAMTAPVIQEQSKQGAQGNQGNQGTWTVSFVLPGDRAIDEYPVPTDPRVSLRAIPRQLAAALRWSGRWTSGNLDKRTNELRQEISVAGWTPIGEPRWARFDPPWKPPFARRNEIVISVVSDTVR